MSTSEGGPMSWLSGIGSLSQARSKPSGMLRERPDRRSGNTALPKCGSRAAWMCQVG